MKTTLTTFLRRATRPPIQERREVSRRERGCCLYTLFLLCPIEHNAMKILLTITLTLSALRMGFCASVRSCETTELPVANTVSASVSKIESFIALQKFISPDVNDATIGKKVILNTGELFSCRRGWDDNGGFYKFSAYEKYLYVKKFLSDDKVSVDNIRKLLLETKPEAIPENAFQAFAQLGLVEKFNMRYGVNAKLYSRIQDCTVNLVDPKLVIMLHKKDREKQELNEKLIRVPSDNDTQNGVKICAFITGLDTWDIIASSNKEGDGIVVSCMEPYSEDVITIGIVLGDDLVAKLNPKMRLYVYVPYHGICSFVLKVEETPCGDTLRKGYVPGRVSVKPKSPLQRYMLLRKEKDILV